MKDLFRDLPIFVEVGRQMSFSRAAERLEMPLATLSRRIAALEKSLGLPLFWRGPRKIEFTENGRQFYGRLKPIVAEVEAAREELLESNQAPQGPVRFSAQTDIYQDYLTGVPAAFAARWPGVSLYGQYSDRWVDLRSEPFDVEIRNMPVADSTLVSRRLASGRPGLYGAPGFLEKIKAPVRPAELAEIPCIILAQRGFNWELSKSDELEKVSVRAAHTVGGMRMALELCLAGLGLAPLATFVAKPHEAKGELVKVLPDWSLPETEINLVMANRKQPKRIRLFVEYLIDHFNGLAADRIIEPPNHGGGTLKQRSKKRKSPA